MTPPSRATRIILLIVGLVTLGVASSVALVLHADQREAAVVAQRQVETLARAAEASLNRNLLGIDLMLAGLVQLPGLLGSDGRLAEPASARALLRASINQSLSARDLVLVDLQGQVVASADPATARLGLALPAGFLEGVLAQNVSQLAISTPTTSARTAERVLYVARLLGPAAQASLVALAEVPVATLSTLIAPSIGTDGLSVVLEDERGTLLASAPANDSLLGRVHPVPLTALLGNAGGGPPAAQPPQPPQPPQTEAGRLDGQPAFVSVRPTLYRSLLVAAALSEATIRAQAADAHAQVKAVGAVFIVLAFVIGGLVQVSLARMAAASTETARAKAVLEEALASMDEGFLLWDAEDRVVSWNDRYLQMFPHIRAVIRPGVPLQTLVEAGADALFPQGPEAERRIWIAERVRHHRGDGIELELPRPDGRVISAVERHTANGGIVSVFHDVTRMKAAAEELDAARRTAEAASEAKTRFLATMSHEIRTPLNGVLGMNGLLLESALDARQRKYAETIRSCGEALLNILNDVLDMSKLVAGRMALEDMPFDPATLVDDVVSLFAARAVERGLTLQVEAAGTASPMLAGDAGRLRQVLFNLVGNAIKFTEQGGVTVRTAARPLAGGDVEWVVAVIDSGIGIPADAMPTLFDRFTQADTSTSRRFGGSGLGLAICRQLIELMGGRIAVHSTVGAGSVFTITVCLAAAPGVALSDATAATSTATAGRPLRVLVAEDNRVNQMLMVAMLERLGHFADVVGDGREALRQIQVARYDVVLMDIQMPEMDGVAATRAIRGLPEPLGRIPIVAVSANVLPEQRAAYLAAGMNDYIPKPFDREQLEAALAELMAAA